MTPTQARLAAERRARLERMHQASLQHFDRCYDEAQKSLMKPAPVPAVADTVPVVSLPALPLGPIATIQEAVCKRFGVDRRDMIGPCRKPVFVKPRRLAMYLARELLSASYPQLAGMFCRHDHSSIIHAVRGAQKEIERSSETAALINELRAELTAEKESAGITPRASAEAVTVSP